MMQTLLSYYAGDLVPILAVGGGLVVAIVGIIAGAVKSSSKTRHREESRRDIAAYVAEGSMTPEQGEKLMAAGERPKRCD